MSDLMEAVSAWLLLAADDKKPPAQDWCGVYMMPSMILIAVLAYFFLFRPEQRERQRKEQLRKELKKNDRVVTIGGIVGTVVSVSDTEDAKQAGRMPSTVVLKIDETTGAKIRVLRSAIHEVIRDESKKEEAKKEDVKKDEPKKDGAKRDEPSADEGGG